MYSLGLLRKTVYVDLTAILTIIFYNLIMQLFILIKLFNTRKFYDVSIKFSQYEFIFNTHENENAYALFHEN